MTKTEMICEDLNSKFSASKFMVNLKLLYLDSSKNWQEYDGVANGSEIIIGVIYDYFVAVLVRKDFFPASENNLNFIELVRNNGWDADIVASSTEAIDFVDGVWRKRLQKKEDVTWKNRNKKNL